MKRNPLILFTGMILILIMTGCPYESPVPLSNSCNSTIDPGLIGTWAYPSPTVKSDTIEFRKFNDHEFYIEVRSRDKTGLISVSRGRGFVTLIKNQKIINYCELIDPPKFYLLRYEISDKKMITYSASDTFIKQSFNSSGELLDFFTKNKNNPGFYEPPDTVIRIK